MNQERSKGICPAERSGELDNKFRKILQNPQKILKPYISEGMTVLDLGCGPGFFSVEIAKMLKDSGKVIAADFQQGMLDKISIKIKGTALEDRTILHKCERDKVGFTGRVDFILAFYMIHEVPNQDKLFREMKTILKPNGKFFITEPRVHVTKKSFEEMISSAKDNGFEINAGPKMFFSRTVMLTLKK